MIISTPVLCNYQSHIGLSFYSKVETYSQKINMENQKKVVIETTDNHLAKKLTYSEVANILNNQKDGTMLLIENANFHDILRWHTDKGHRLVHQFQQYPVD